VVSTASHHPEEYPWGYPFKKQQVCVRPLETNVLKLDTKRLIPCRLEGLGRNLEPGAVAWLARDGEPVHNHSATK
jgi:hypothetical protein